MFPITVYHGSAVQSLQPDGRPIYLTSNPSYGYIQACEHTYQATFHPRTPYWTDNQQFIESLRQNPDMLNGLRALGYDAVIYANPRNLTKGASGWGNDYAQFVALSPNVLQGWKTCVKPERYNNHQEDIPTTHLVGPLFHGTDEFFLDYDTQHDIGIHFGTQSASQDRVSKTRRVANLTTERMAPSFLDNERLRYASDERPVGPTAMIYGLLLKKLNSPKSNLYQIIDGMTALEQAELAKEYIDKPDASDYKDSLERATFGVYYAVKLGEKVIHKANTPEQASWFMAAAQAHLVKKAYLHIKNPLDMEDLGTWSALSVLQRIPNGHLHYEALSQANNAAQEFDVVKAALQSEGYDGIRYINQVEDNGSLSYIALHAEQIIPISPRLPPLPEATAVRHHYDAEPNARRRQQ